MKKVGVVYLNIVSLKDRKAKYMKSLDLCDSVDMLDDFINNGRADRHINFALREINIIIYDHFDEDRVFCDNAQDIKYGSLCELRNYAYELRAFARKSIQPCLKIIGVK